MTKGQFKAALKKLGWGQRTFARQVVKVNERTVRRWAKGDSKVPNTVETLLKNLLDART